jgi:hypothetical protein
MAYLAKFDPTLNDWRTNTNTMNTKHTPGPWNYAHGSTDLLTHDGDDVAYVDTAIPNRSKSEQLANARLIAAAPDLLEALQILSETAGRVAQGAAVIDERGFNTLSHSISAALAAIDKATK